MNRKKLILMFLLSALIVKNVEAHCPLCTGGAALATAGAVWLGISKAVVGIFIGALGASTGFWFSKLIKKKFISYQDEIITFLSFLLTVVPLMPLISQIVPIYLSITGDYGSLLNRTYLINISILTSIIGGIIVLISPAFSKKIKDWRNGKMIPYQGISLTFGLLFLSAIITQLLI